jgi:predicted O-methyltransferase YrrM
MIRTIDPQKAYAFGVKWLASWAVVNWNYTLALASSKGRSVVYGVANHLGLDALGRKRAQLPQVPCEAVVPKLTAQVTSPEPVDGNVSLLELLVMCTVAKESGAKAAFEIGTFNGRTALNLALNMPADGEVFTLDLPAEDVSTVAGVLDSGNVHYVTNHTPGDLFQRWAGTERARITQLLGDSATFDYTPYMGKMDVVFIDGAHSYDYVRRDTESAMNLLRGGKGTVFWHDYDACIGVIEFVDELAARHPEYAIRHVAGTKLAYMQR